ncbi:hypothetical protein CGRA01v4_13210 [Colletotrichum graminicola]|nr:hypothetical protein CGRA01v4_13210 [Colletotrichum graminicola]
MTITIVRAITKVIVIVLIITLAQTVLRKTAKSLSAAVGQNKKRSVYVYILQRGRSSHRL